MSRNCFSRSMCSRPAFRAAASMIGAGNPILRAISTANELPGSPVCRRNNGRMFCTSNIMAPFSTPG